MITFKEVQQREKEYREAKKELIERLVEETKGVRGLILTKKFEDELIKEAIIDSLEKIEYQINYLDSCDSMIEEYSPSSAEHTIRRIEGQFKLIDKLMR